MFSVSLGLSAHHRAIERSGDCDRQWKMQQIYLNHLAIYAVDFYLQTQGFICSEENCDSASKLKRSLVDVADLSVRHCGHVECRPILTDAEFVYIPADVWSNRVAYIAVEIDADLETATLLGFLKQISAEQVSREQLQPLEQLVPFLQQRQDTHPNHLLEKAIAMGQQLKEDLFNTQVFEPAFSFRGQNNDDLGTPLDFRQIALEIAGKSVELILSFVHKTGSDHSFFLTIQPLPSETYLPEDLHLAMLDENNMIILEAYTKAESKNINFEFEGNIGDRFSLRLSDSVNSHVEDFVI